MIVGPIFALLALIGLIAIFVWMVQWASHGDRSPTALDILDRRLARGDIDKTEYEEMRKLIGRR